jgi:hypothetical protein
LDDACAYILEQLQHKKLPQFPKDGMDEPKQRDAGWSTNSDLAAEMIKANQGRK